MVIQAKFLRGRIYFGTYNQYNDLNSQTKRSGLNFFRFNLIGRLLYFLGFAYRVPYITEEKKGVVYLHPNSFKIWKERHSNDPNLDVNSLNQAVVQKKFENAIKIICDNFSKNMKPKAQEKISDLTSVPKEIPETPTTVNISKEKKEATLLEEGSNTPLLLKPPQLNNNVIFEILSHLDLSTLKTTRLVSKDWKQVASNLIQQKIAAVTFGKQKWAELGLEVEDLPFPENINEILKSPCPFSTDGKTVAETHVLVLRPENINGEPLNIHNFGRFMASKFPELDRSGYQYIRHGRDNGIELADDRKSCWLLMKKKVIGRDKNLWEQEDMIKHIHEQYQLPEPLDVIICAMAEYVRSKSKVRLFQTEESPLLYSYTRCKNRIANGALYNTHIVGDFRQAGLAVRGERPESNVPMIGVAPVRKFYLMNTVNLR